MPQIPAEPRINFLVQLRLPTAEMLRNASVRLGKTKSLLVDEAIQHYLQAAAAQKHADTEVRAP